MVSLAKKIKAEARMRQIVAEGGLAQPDVVEYGEDCVRFFWHDAKAVVIVDIEGDGEIGPSRLGPPLPPV